MINFIIEYLNIVSSFIATYFLMLFPMWKIKNVKDRLIGIYSACHLFIVITALIYFRQSEFTSIEHLSTLKFIIGALMVPLPFLVYRKNKWQVIFLLAIAFAYNLIPTGIGNFALDNWYSPAEYPMLVATVITYAVILITLPPLLIVLRSLFNNPSTQQTSTFWRLIWMMPMMFFAIFLTGNNYLFAGEIDTVYFFTFRAVIYIALTFTCYLFDTILRKVWEAETARQQVEEQTKKTDFYRRMSHSLRTPLTRVSTSVQVVMDHPEMAEELLSDAQTDIMGMSKIISEALDDGASGGAGK